MKDWLILLILCAAAIGTAVYLLATGPRLMAHLIIKYLRRRRIAWVSLLAVTLCTTMVLVVISVMGGWLSMFEHSFKGLTGDIVVESESLAGFPYYQEMIDKLQKQPGIAAAVPTIHTFGIVNIGNRKTAGVQVIGLPIDTIGKVNNFPQSLWLQDQQYIEAAKETNDPKEKQKLLDEAAKHAEHPTFALPLPASVYRNNPTVSKAKTDPSTFPGMIPGSMILEIHREKDGSTAGRFPGLYELPVKLTTIAIHPGEIGVDEKDKSETIYWIVDDSHTGLWQYDNNSVYVPFDRLQKDLQMTAQPSIDMKTGAETEDPARTSDIHIRVKDGYDLNEAKKEVEKVVGQVLDAHIESDHIFIRQPIIETWREKQHVWIDAITNEKLLTVILFGIISIVAVFLVFCIFYMIVMEKTKDIGIIKSVGATSTGVAGIFLGYGLVIGLVGSFLGLLSSFLIVHYINEMHAWLGRRMGIQIWDPQVYLFDKIPNTMNWHDVAVILPIAIVSCVLGALIPAIRAAQMHPVESLRWE